MFCFYKIVRQDNEIRSSCPKEDQTKNKKQPITHWKYHVECTFFLHSIRFEALNFWYVWGVFSHFDAGFGH